MIVVDTNIIAYLLLPTSYADSIDALYEIESNWVAPTLWKSEFRNVLNKCIKKNIIGIEKALQLQEIAESLLVNNEFNVPSAHILTLVNNSQCSAYICEYIALAQYLNIQIVTQDKKILHEFPDIAISMADFIRQKLSASLIAAL